MRVNNNYPHLVVLCLMSAEMENVSSSKSTTGINSSLIIFDCERFASFLNSINVERARSAEDGRRCSQRSIQPGLYWVSAPADSCDTAP